MSDQGYIRLQWRLGRNQFVETYEHRVVDGRVTTAEHVHHKNGDRADNRRENLEFTTAVGHINQHYPQREAQIRQMADLYQAGLSTVRIAELFGVDSSVVSSRLRAAGVAIRPKNHLGKPLDPDDVIQRYLAEGSVDRVRQQLGACPLRIRRILDDAGVPRPLRRAAGVGWAR